MIYSDDGVYCGLGCICTFSLRIAACKSGVGLNFITSSVLVITLFTNRSQAVLYELHVMAT